VALPGLPEETENELCPAPSGATADVETPSGVHVASPGNMPDEDEDDDWLCDCELVERLWELVLLVDDVLDDELLVDDALEELLLADDDRLLAD